MPKLQPQNALVRYAENSHPHPLLRYGLSYVIPGLSCSMMGPNKYGIICHSSGRVPIQPPWLLQFQVRWPFSARLGSAMDNDQHKKSSVSGGKSGDE